MNSRFGGSQTSVYVTDEEEIMECEAKSVGGARGGKRRSSSRSEEESTGVKEALEPVTAKRGDSMAKRRLVDRKEAEGIEMMAIRKKEKSEKRRREKEKAMVVIAVEEQRLAREKQRDTQNGKEEMEEEECENRVTIQEQLKKILTAAEKENGGKISVTRGDQVTVRVAVGEIKDEIIELMKRQMKIERRIRGLESDKEEVEKKSKVGGQDGGKKGRNVKPRREVVSEESDSTESWQERKVRRRRRTYAEVSASGSKSGSKIEGRVVVTGEEGWKTPPTRSNQERAIIVQSREEKSARKLAETHAKNISLKDIGGAPQVVRKVRDGKVVIVPKDSVQKDKIVGNLKKMSNVEVRETKKVEPLLMISGVARGMTDEDISDRIVRGLDESREVGKEEVKIIKRVGCRNPWKEKVVIRVNSENFKYLVKKGKIEMDCMLYFVEEYLGLAMCYRCCRFGHMMKNCGEAEVCHKCGAGMMLGGV